jgi:hypothetical protein
MMVIVDPAGGPGAVARTVVSRPALLERLAGPARVTVVAAPAGSGKTVLLRSWLGQPELDGRAAWVAAERGERDPQRFWVSVAGALRQTGGGAELVRAVTGAPDLDGWGLVERLLADPISPNCRAIRRAVLPVEQHVLLKRDLSHDVPPRLRSLFRCQAHRRRQPGESRSSRRGENHGGVRRKAEWPGNAALDSHHGSVRDDS